MKFYVTTACVALATTVAAAPQPINWENLLGNITNLIPKDIDDVNAGKAAAVNQGKEVLNFLKSYSFNIDVNKIGKAADDMIKATGKEQTDKLSNLLANERKTDEKVVEDTMDALVGKAKARKDEVSSEVKRLLNKHKGKTVKKIRNQQFMKINKKINKDIKDKDVKALFLSLVKTLKQGATKNTRKYNGMTGAHVVNAVEEKYMDAKSKAKAKVVAGRNNAEEKVNEKLASRLSDIKSFCNKFMKDQSKCAEFYEQVKAANTAANRIVKPKAITQFFNKEVADLFKELGMENPLTWQ